MIFDSIANWELYFRGEDFVSVKKFLLSLSETTGDGEYPIKGNEIFARVMTYQTKPVSDATFESHRDYLDIQTVITGSEGIAWNLAENLVIKEPYDVDKDVEFYVTPPSFPAKVDVVAGYFVLLFPHDAHMPQLQVEGLPPQVKKAVVKVHKSLYPAP